MVAIGVASVGWKREVKKQLSTKEKSMDYNLGEYSMKRSKAQIYTTSIIACLGMGATGGSAQDALESEQEQGFQFKEIVITAQKRVQSKQDVPISVSVYTDDFLKASSVTGISGLIDYTPGLSGTDIGTGTPNFAIRGISSNSFGIGGEASVGIFVDDAYLGRITTSSLAFLDVARVEVLKGPQGTLFGRNSSAGAISIATNKPNEEPSIDLQASGARFGTYSAEATANVPLGDTVFARASVVYRKGSGFSEDVATGEGLDGGETLGGRVSLLFDQTSVRFQLTAYGQTDDSDAPGYDTADSLLASFGGLTVDPFDRKTASGEDQHEKRNVYGGIGRLEWTLDNGLDITSITTFNHYDYDALFDLDGSAAFISNANFGNEEADTFGQEIRINGETGNLVWFIGASYFHEKVSAQTDLQYNEFFVVGGTPIPADAFFPGSPAFEICDATSDAFLGACSGFQAESVTQSGKYNSYAVYGDATWALSDRLNVSGGLRASLDKKDFTFNAPLIANASTALLGDNLVGYSTSGPVGLTDEWSALQPRLAFDYTLSEDVLGYISVSRGYKSGGFDPAASIELAQYDEETVWAYEAGLKTTLAGGRVQFNVAGYYQDYKDFQTQVIRNGIARTINVSGVEGYGAEIELLAQPTDELMVMGSASFSSSKVQDLVIDSGDLSGHRTIRSPNVMGSLVAQYTFNQVGNWQPFVRGELNYEGVQYFTLENSASEAQQAYTLINARIGVQSEDGRWSASLFGTNLANEKYFTDSRDFGFGIVTLAGRPRVIGVEVAAKF